MTEYVVLLPDDEAAWDAASEEERQQVYRHDEEFARLLAERGGRITGGRELTASREAWSVRARPDGTAAVTEGPYVETVEQVSGFYFVECDALDDLLVACEFLAQKHGGVEVRPIAGSS